MALAAFVVVTVAWYLFDTTHLHAQNTVCWLSLAAMHIWVVVLGPRVARQHEAPTHRRVWWAVTTAVYFFLIGDLIQLVAIAQGPMTSRTVAGVPAQEALVDIGVLVLVIGMLTAPLGLRTAREHLRFWLDVGTVIAAGLAWGFYAAGRSSWDLGTAEILLRGPLLFLIGLFAVTRLLFSAVPPFTRQAGLLAASAAMVETTVQGVDWPRFAASDRLNWLIAATIIGNALFTASVIVQHYQGTVADASDSVRRRRFSVLPYLAIASVYLVHVLTLALHGLDIRAWIALTAAIACTALVVIRQVIAFVDNSRLLTELDEEVARRKELSAELHHQAYHDSLTGLANRALFTDRLEDAIARAPEAGAVAVIIVDLDDFKPVNDSLGHRVGDALLSEVAERLRGCVRDSDTVARLGGDEFGILLLRAHRGLVVSITDRVVAALGTVAEAGGHQVSTSASVGAAIDHTGRIDADTLLHAADSAMYAAKRRAKGSAKIVVLDGDRPAMAPRPG